MRKILSLVLCACLVLSLSVCSFADDALNPGTYEASAQFHGNSLCSATTHKAIENQIAFF